MPDAVDTELALAPREDVRVGPVGAAMAAEEEAAPNPISMVLDRLHGRWLWIVLCAVVLVPTFAVAGFLLTPVTYASSGLINIEAEVDPVTEGIKETGTMSNFPSFVLEQTMQIKSDRVLTEAMNDPRLQPFAAILRERGVVTLADGLSVNNTKGTGLISVQFESTDPLFSAAAANAVIDAYKRITSPESEKKIRERLANNRDQLQKVESDIGDKNVEMSKLLAESPWRTIELDPLVQDRVRKLESTTQSIAEADVALQRIVDALPPEARSAPPADARLEPSMGELDAINPNLPAIRRQIDETETQLELAKKNYSPKHPIFQNVEKRLGLYRAQLDRELENAKDAWKTGPGRAVSYGEIADGKKRLEERFQALQGEIDTMNRLMLRASNIRRELTRLEEERMLYSDRIKELSREEVAITDDRIKFPIQAAPNPKPSKDRRVPMAAAGALAGVGIPIVFFFLLGTLDKRTFGTRQLAGHNPGKLLCAGAIPDMDALKDDPQNRDLASNCVHRIRTRIESRRTPGDGYALMVSSPFQGDGKTTLAVALAWSYAESGARTLLVDCDFIGQALSFQFGHLAAPGVREALQGADSTGLIVSVGDSLGLLPVGRDRHFGASRVHPTGLRRLFRELRNRYDVIIVDTGPMTASIEALPVASAVDGVVLSLRRGRSRQRLDECIADIGSVGAEYLGVVLNYADRKDCMRYGSVSRMSEDVTKALEGRSTPAPAHPLLAAIQSGGGRGKDSITREGDAA
ncbi:MAG: hypothetical protein JNM94_12670 [Phycisphaerae bacterium]|nr:hypothetical protein [Phycisphaerae bacterium]